MSAPADRIPRSALVIGGGVVGMSCALGLQARGISVTLIDQRSAVSASRGNAGHIAVEQVEPLASVATLRALPGQLFSRGGPVSLPLREIATWLPFALRFVRASRPSLFRAGAAALSRLAEEALPAWRRQLAGAGAPDLLVENGHFAVWGSPAAAEAGRRRWAAANTGAVKHRAASDDELAALSMHLRQPSAGGIRFCGSAQVADLDELAAALMRSFERNGGTVINESVSSLRPGVGTTAAVLENGDTLVADAMVVAAGAASGKLLAPLGHRVPLIAERGYHLHSAETEWPADMPPVVFEERAMIVTRFRSGLRAAGFFEFGRANSPADPRKWARLRRHLEELGIGFGPQVSQWMGARPTLPDYLPAIGRSSRAPGVYYAFGHQHLGLTLSAVTGEAIGALVAGEPTAVDLAPFSVDRFVNIRR